MLYNPINLFLSLLLLSNVLPSALANFLGYRVGIQRDRNSPGFHKPGLQDTYIYSSVAVYEPEVDTTAFSAQELYGLAQLGWIEMQQLFKDDTVGGRQAPYTMSAMAVGNLVYFSSSMKGTHYILGLSEDDDISLALQKCQSGLQAQAGEGVAIQPTHRAKARCGEVGCLLYQARDQEKMIPRFNPNKRVIVAYGGNKGAETGNQMPCCGSPAVPGSNNDPTSWGCYHFMQSQGVLMLDTTADTLSLPAVQPSYIRYVPIC